MNISIKLLSLVLFVMLCESGFSQSNLVLYHLKDFDNTGFFRPNAIKNNYNVQVSILPFGASANVYSPFSIDNSFTANGSSNISNLDKLYEHLGSKNIILQESSLPIFDIKVWTTYGQFEFGIRDNFNSLMPIDKEAIKFLNEGNAKYVGKTFSSSLNAEIMHFRDFSFGYVHENLEDLWSYGVRLKILMGIGMIRTNLDYSIETGANVEYLDLAVSGDTKVSFPFTKSYGDQGFINNIALSDNTSFVKYMAGAANLGLGLDLSARYEGFRNWELEVCAENLGAIRWAKTLNSIDVNGNYKWEGLELPNDLTRDAFNDFLEDINTISVKDSISSNLKIEDNEKPFTTTIPSSVVFSAKYILNRNIDLALVDRVFYSNRFAQNSIALSGNFKFGRYFALSTGLLVKGKTFSNIMLGCGVNRKNISLFVGSDNIAAFLMPAMAKNFSLSFGMSYRFIHRSRIAKKLMRNMPFFRPKRF